MNENLVKEITPEEVKLINPYDITYIAMKNGSIIMVLEKEKSEKKHKEDFLPFFKNNGEQNININTKKTGTNDNNDSSYSFDDILNYNIIPKTSQNKVDNKKIYDKKTFFVKKRSKDRLDNDNETTNYNTLQNIKGINSYSLRDSSQNNNILSISCYSKDKNHNRKNKINNLKYKKAKLSMDTKILQNNNCYDEPPKPKMDLQIQYNLKSKTPIISMKRGFKYKNRYKDGEINRHKCRRNYSRNHKYYEIKDNSAPKKTEYKIINSRKSRGKLH